MVKAGEQGGAFLSGGVPLSALARLCLALGCARPWAAVDTRGDVVPRAHAEAVRSRISRPRATWRVWGADALGRA